MPKNILVKELDRIQLNLNKKNLNKNEVKELIDDLMLVVNSCPKPKEKLECAICFDEIKNKNMCSLNCGHEFHFSCILDLHQGSSSESFSNKCPICRGTIYKYEAPSDDAALERIHDISANMSSNVGRLVHSVTHMTSDEITFFESMFRQ